MSQRHVLICNERILFRYGVDRILVELAQKFIAEGWRVTFVCLRSDAALVRAIDARVVTPSMRDGADLYDIEQACADFLESGWRDIASEAPVSLIVSGGWPFFCTAFVGGKRAVPSIFIDAGAVPHDGLDEQSANVQRAVRRLRRLALPHFDCVLPISRFIAESQTIPDRGSSQGVNVVPLGVDHFAPKGEAGSRLAEEAEDALLRRLRELAGEGTRLILNLGRFEPVGYKNSQMSFALLREMQTLARDAGRKDDVRLLVLADEADVEAPSDLESAIIYLGKPSDEALAEIMSVAEIGFSPSLWEGFNLPIGEMSILAKPAFAFNIGAHPETILHPWFLCASVAEAADKIDRTLRGAAPRGLMASDRIAAYRDSFSWARTLAAYHAIAEETIAAARPSPAPGELLVVDVTNASRDAANSGVVRVARRLSAELQKFGRAHLVFVHWDAQRGAYSLVAGAREALLAGYSGPVTGFMRLFSGEREPTLDDILHCAPGQVSRAATLLISEFVLDGDTAARIAWARARSLNTAAILYDLIPIDFPHLCGPDVRAEAPIYLEALSRVDSVIAISAYSLGRFEYYLRKRGLPLPSQRAVAWLPGQLGATPRTRTPGAASSSDAVSILCVSTIEPRKNHRAMLSAYATVRQACPALDLRLTLIGNSYHGAEALAAEVNAAVARDPSIEWRQAVSDEELTAAARSAAFTVYPSLVEGFGLPILESLWVGKPCICHSDGVMAELAAGGGCLTVDMRDATALAEAIRSLSTDRRLLERLSAEARAREIDAWPDYARHVARLLDLDPPHDATVDEESALDAVRERIAQDAYFMDHRLRGLGLISGIAAPEPTSAEAAAPATRPLAALTQSVRRVRTRATGLLRWIGWRRVTIAQVRASGVFDAAWYLEQYPDVREAGIDPALHFARFGHLEGRTPGPEFDSRRRGQRPEPEAGLSAFESYLRQKD